jgi:predicted ATP-grasp superfamily ATP-dependent carboligase
MFGEAINAYNAASAATDATEEIRTKARVAIELIQEINGFVNVDLMNP